jgi:hypothetical protein
MTARIHGSRLFLPMLNPTIYFRKIEEKNIKNSELCIGTGIVFAVSRWLGPRKVCQTNQTNRTCFLFSQFVPSVSSKTPSFYFRSSLRSTTLCCPRSTRIALPDLPSRILLVRVRLASPRPWSAPASRCTRAAILLLGGWILGGDPCRWRRVLVLAQRELN